MKLENEKIPACWVCGKVHERKDVDLYYYFQGMVVCSHHDGSNKGIDKR